MVINAASKVQFTTNSDDNEILKKIMKKTVGRLATPGVKKEISNRRSAMYNFDIPKPNFDSEETTDESELCNLSSCQTPTRQVLRQFNNGNSDSSDLEYNNINGGNEGEHVKFSDEEFNYTIEDICKNVNKSNLLLSSSKKKPSALAGNAWHRQLRRRKSILNPRRQSEKVKPALKAYEVPKAKTRRSYACTTEQASHNVSIKNSKGESSKKSSFKLSCAKPVENKLRRSALLTLKETIDSKKKSSEEQGKSAISKSEIGGRGTISSSQTQDIKIKSHQIIKKTAPSIVNTDNGVVVKNQEVLYFGIPLEKKKQNTKVQPFSFEARNKEFQMKKEQRLKTLQNAQRKKLSPVSNVKPTKITPKMKSGKTIEAKVVQGVSNVADKFYVKKPTITQVNNQIEISKNLSQPDTMPNSKQNKELKESAQKEIKANTKFLLKEQAAELLEKTETGIIFKKYVTKNKKLEEEVRQLKNELEKAKNQNQNDKVLVKLKQTGDVSKNKCEDKVSKLEIDVSYLQTVITKLESRIDDLEEANYLLHQCLTKMQTDSSASFVVKE